MDGGRREDCPLTERELHVARVVGEHYARIMRRVVVAMTVVALIALAGNVTGWVLVRREASHRAAELAGETSQRADEIQASRLQILIDGCVATNGRNVNTNRALDDMAPAKPTVRSRQATAAARLLVDALVPFTDDCVKSARDRLTASSKP